MEILAIITPIVTVLSVFITAVLTHIFTSKRDKYGKVYDHKLKILTDVYTPIYRYMMDEVEPGEEYGGLSVDTYHAVKDILESNIHLIEPGLESMLWQLNEQYYYIDHMRTKNFDEDKKFMRYVVFQYNLLRKDLGLPYDKSRVSIKKRVQMYSKENKRIS
ncbi:MULTISPECIES: hypothetical protein [Bacillus cereus group]|uniref:hypothetical protein n=1 Tax=Bacillus cereus group TaxID=86661 RepID=UPI000BFE0FE4|nr:MULTISPECIES: hypothetical protein [Bacillus cereus group]PGM03795.1 hypothetical protein CN938_29775 [Bacillus thuringiensis]